MAAAQQYNRRCGNAVYEVLAAKMERPSRLPPAHGVGFSPSRDPCPAQLKNGENLLDTAAPQCLNRKGFAVVKKLSNFQLISFISQ
jgi:hypothetical protein